MTVEAQRAEQQRRNLTADVAHELRNRYTSSRATWGHAGRGLRAI
jgi:signal transduction histidine kinase